MRILVPGIVLSFLAAATVAQAGPAAMGPDVRSVSVPVTDLNLSRPAGADALLARIEQAAGAVCGGTPLPRELRLSRQYRACRAESVERAVRKLDVPMVTARFNRQDAATVAEAR